MRVHAYMLICDSLNIVIAIISDRFWTRLKHRNSISQSNFFCFDILLYAMPSGINCSHSPQIPFDRIDTTTTCAVRAILSFASLTMRLHCEPVWVLSPLLFHKWNWKWCEMAEKDTHHVPVHPYTWTINGNHKLFIVFTLCVFLLSFVCWLDVERIVFCVSIYLQRNFELVHSHVMCQINIDW